jgi:FtsP/CotA-like multicopper oxidase with cupredoxin domain
MNRGDRLLVNLTNNLPNATTLHWHGLFQNGTNWMDGTTGVTQCPVPPGSSFLYNFTVENQYGTYWYHAHFSTQYVDGIVGPLVIHAPEEAQVRAQYDYDQVVLLQDWYHDLTSSLIPEYFASGNENAEPVPDNGLIQGENYFNCSSYDSDSGYDCSNSSSRPVFALQENKRYRLRFINTGAFTSFQVSVDNHTLDIIEADGTIVSPLPIHRFEIATAERYSVVLNANQSSSSNYWLRAQMNEACYATDNDVLDPLVLGLVTYTNTTTAPTASVDWSDAPDITCKDLNNTLLTPVDVEQAPPADVLYEIAFSFIIGDYAIDKAHINGTSWVPDTTNPTINQAVAGLHANNASFTSSGVSSAFSPDQLVISVPDAQVIDLLVLNFDDG